VDGTPSPRLGTVRTTNCAALDCLEAQITELWGHLNAAIYRFLLLVAEFDRSEAYARHGLVSTAQWLNWQCGIGKVAAREKVRVARALDSLPEISAAFASGEFSYSKVRAMTRVATCENESVLVSIGRHGTATHVENLVKKYRWTQRRDAGAIAHAQQLNRQVHSFYDINDTFVLHARLPPDVGALVRKALEIAGDIVRERSIEDERAHAGADAIARSRSELAAGTWAINDKERSYAARRADALKLIVETFLATKSADIEDTSSANRCQFVVHVDQAVLAEPVAANGDEPHRCELDDGPALALDTARRLGCDCTIVGIVEGADGEPLNVGRKTRSIPLPLKRALRSRDGGCRFPGCDRTRFTEGHHVKHWADGGETKLSNLVSLCDFHHKLVHEGGFGVTSTDNGLFVFTRPDGRRIPECGRNPCTDLEPGRFRGSVSPHMEHVPDGTLQMTSFEDALRFHTERLNPGVAIDAHTSRCKWLGERMDYDMAIEGMQFRDDRVVVD
jgi:Domain of unknown function (DUF222)/HNH endonuclease